MEQRGTTLFPRRDFSTVDLSEVFNDPLALNDAIQQTAGRRLSANRWAIVGGCTPAGGQTAVDQKLHGSTQPSGSEIGQVLAKIECGDVVTPADDLSRPEHSESNSSVRPTPENSVL